MFKFHLFKSARKEKSIPRELITALTNSYENEDVWQIHRGDYWLTVFLYQENQIERNRDLPKYAELRKKYLELVNKYLSPEITEIYLTFDTKENFESKFGGNWYDYYN